MEKIKKTLFMVATGLVASTAITVVATSNSSILENTFAGGTVINDKERTTTFDSETPLTINGTTGTATVGNIGVYVPNCSALSGGVTTLNNGESLYLYCPTAGTNDSGNQYGFFGSTVASVSIVVNNHSRSNSKLLLNWVQLDGNFNVINGPYSQDAFTLTTTDEDQSKATISGDTFLRGQHSGYNCIALCHNRTDVLDIISLTVQYSCN